MDKKKFEGPPLTRRQFTKGATAAAFAAMLGPNWPKILEKARAQSMVLPNEWDAEHDVVVVGGGVAGAAACLGAWENKADVVLLESAPAIGGTSAMSGGMFHLGGGTKLQRDLGVYETEEDYYQYLVANAELSEVEHGIPNQPSGVRYLQRVHVDHSVETFDFLEDELGLIFLRLLATPATNMSFGGLMFIGQEHHPSVLKKVRRGFPHLHTQSAMGVGLMKKFEEYLRGKDIPIMTMTKANHLIMDPITGAAIGVKAIRRGKELNIKAKRGVVLAGGGHGHAGAIKSLINELPLSSIEDASFRPAGCDGSGIRMGLEVGGDFFACDGGQFLTAMWGTLALPLAGMLFLDPWWNGIYVGRDGKRFTSEEYHMTATECYWYHTGKWNWQTKRWDLLPAGWMIFDAASRAAMFGINGAPAKAAGIGGLMTGKPTTEFEIPGYGKALRCKIVSGRTLESLCAGSRETDPEGLGINPKGLKETIDQWNRYQPYDPTCGRTHGMLPIKAPPYYAAPLWITNFNEATGILIDENGQVLNTSGELIPRLYSAGRNSGGQFGQFYPCGMAVSSGFTIGRVAGGNVARESRWVE